MKTPPGIYTLLGFLGFIPQLTINGTIDGVTLRSPANIIT
jgi:hypothetical protein